MTISVKFWLILTVLLFACPAITNCANLRCYDGSLHKYVVISFNNPSVLFKSNCYQPERKTVVYAFGYEEKADGPSTHAIVGAYLGKVNILLLNWEYESDTGVRGISYGFNAVPNSMKVGKQFGGVLVQLNATGLSLSTVHLIGFSLGAQLMASAAKVVKKNNLTIARITGLDPAGPLYEGIIRAPTRLEASSADFVDVVHSNPGGYGTVESSGTVDFWSNCGSVIQSACINRDLLGSLTRSNLCSHNMSWRYYAEALKNSAAFAARSAPRCSSWILGDGKDEVIYMGDEVDTQARGNFFFRTSATSPYGLGEAGTQPAY